MNKKEIIILGFKFKLIFSDKLSDEELGRCDCTYQKIFINPNQGEDSIRDTLLHEIIHAISYLMGLTDDDPEEERLRLEEDYRDLWEEEAFHANTMNDFDDDNY